MTAVMTLVVAAMFAAVPSASMNAVWRWLMPWKPIPRYTFAQLEPLPNEIIVPYAEPFTFQVGLASRSAWKPRTGKAVYSRQQSAVATLSPQQRYVFSFRSATEKAELAVAIGDARTAVTVHPENRPEILSMRARITLPDYLHRNEERWRDVRSGFVSVVRGSRIVFEGTASRELAAATLNNTHLQVAGRSLTTPSIAVERSQKLIFTWRDRLGLVGKQPFSVELNSVPDRAPVVVCDGIESGRVLLEDEVLRFNVQAEDDFGVKKVGLQWNAVSSHPPKNDAKTSVLEGERTIAAGGPDRVKLQAIATFCARREHIGARTFELRTYVEDYLPGRPRIWSPPYTIHVMTTAQHMVWLNQQFMQWLHRAEEVYDTEQQLHVRNRQLRQLSPKELERPATRRRIKQQAIAERTNAARLATTTRFGEYLATQAAKNSEFQVGHLETLSEMLLKLKAIAATKMPSIADLLQQSASAPAANTQTEQPRPVAVDHRRVPTMRGNTQPSSAKNAKPSVPSVTDIESGFNKNPGRTSGGKKETRSSLGLLNTTLLGGTKPNKKKSCPVGRKLDQATENQEELLAEFEKLRDALRKLLGNIEGSTFVKRLKAAARRQLDIADDVNRHLLTDFGVRQDRIEHAQRQTERMARLQQAELKQSQVVDTIRSDMRAYFARQSLTNIRDVLKEMNSMRVVAKLQQIGDQIARNMTGESIVRAEYWADTLDRWAENLVDPASGGT